MDPHVSVKSKAQSKLVNASFVRDDKLPITLQEVIKELMEDSLILTSQMELIYANDKALQILRQLNHDKSSANEVPMEIQHLCQPLIESRELFPNQHWQLHFEILTNDFTCLHIEARCLQLEAPLKAFLLITIEDRHQAIKDIAFGEAQTYGLTPREQEVWVLHRHNYTYDQIASELFVSPSTVKKHMANIHLKQKEALNKALHPEEGLSSTSNSSDRIIQLKSAQPSYCDSVREFVDLALRPSNSPEAKAENQELYGWYLAFCKAHKSQAHSMTRFISRLKKILPRHRVKRQFKRVHGQRLTIRAHWQYLVPIDGVFENIQNRNPNEPSTVVEWDCIKSRCSKGGLAKFLDFGVPALES